ncbi:MAG TPA: bifunctional 23S rRNA (guanine(2069)-N(7))-methyltransferase RlmK/23S rRNA (guanine(2445)-N(2))-methyltransferase RlmL [Steroidobacteraceae bacterium]|nr:bifunctional 23S rRNA (guanine(2069)-N(7))-methyltransferase RlmK/23S rRNA (guanine(2445)-N(2))-methyltransferase RlmL [Steroidobacteraceae bacterium]
MNARPLRFVASAPRGLADLLARELTTFGAADVRERSTGVTFAGTLDVAYRACLHSRTANRVFLELGEWDVATADDFYAAARRIDWSAHLAPAATLACDFSGRHPAITHTHFGALKLKDAIVDSLRESSGFRPDISTDRPSVRVHAHAQNGKVAISIDLSGESLHRRGYRGSQGEAPLKENVAAGVLLRSGWPELAAAGAEFLDPMCGSGTFVIEAALIAADIAPGLTRDYFGFLGWRGHDAPLWERLRAEAVARVKPADAIASIIRGQDRDARAIRAARENAERAGVDAFVRFSVQPLDTAAPMRAAADRESLDEGGGADSAGLLAVNPPYGVRLEDLESARASHRQLGDVLRERFQGWQAAVLTAPALGLELGIRAYRTHTLWNGPLECRLLRLKIEQEAFRDRVADRGAVRVDPALTETPGARMFANRLAKNLKQIQKWARSEGVTCYRVYDADMPEYAFAIDSYRVIGEEPEGARVGEYRLSEQPQDWLHVQEYAAPASIDQEAVRRRRAEAFSVLPEVTGVPPERIRVRVRKRQTRGNQYRKVAEQFRFHIVEEGGLELRVNFDDYLDTGLFLDHRPTRARIRELARDKRFLNLFSYTGTVTVHAAAGGARSSVSVDLSRTYLDWAERNLALNGLATRDHRLVQADCREWLAEAGRGLEKYREKYDLIFLDPPTFSNSKRMEGVLDIARDHAALIDSCMKVLAPDGLLVFSTNAQKFKLDPGVSERYEVRDISAATIPRDFARNPRIHRCYDIRKRSES